jgi:hypothetical protein
MRGTQVVRMLYELMELIWEDESPAKEEHENPGVGSLISVVVNYDKMNKQY